MFFVSYTSLLSSQFIQFQSTRLVLLLSVYKTFSTLKNLHMWYVSKKTIGRCKARSKADNTSDIVCSSSLSVSALFDRSALVLRIKAELIYRAAPKYMIKIELFLKGISLFHPCAEYRRTRDLVVWPKSKLSQPSILSVVIRLRLLVPGKICHYFVATTDPTTYSTIADRPLPLYLC